MKKIDDIFKDGLQDKGLPYSDANWNMMAALLDKKVNFFVRYKWWLRSAVFVGLTGSIIGLHYFFSDSLHTASSSDTMEMDIISQSSKEKSISLNQEKTKSNYSQKLQEGIAEITQSKNFMGNESLSKDSFEGIKLNHTIQKSMNIFGDDQLLDLKRITNIDHHEASSIKGISELNLVHGDYPKKMEDDLEEDQLSQIIEDKFQEDIIPAFRLNHLEILKLDPRVCNGFDYVFPNASGAYIEGMKNPNTSWVFYASVYGAALQYQRKLSMGSITDENNLKSKESSQITSGFGVHFSAQKGRWSWVSGLGIKTIQEQTNYQTTYTETHYVYGLKLLNRNYTTTPRGTTIALIGDVIVDSTSSTVAQDLCVDCMANFQYWSIPLRLQYNTKSRNRLSYYGALGVDLDILKSTTGFYTDADHGVLITKDLSEAVLKSTVIQLHGAIGAKYSITSRWKLWTGLGYGYSLQSMTKNYSQKPRIQSLNLGVEFKLN